MDVMWWVTLGASVIISLLVNLATPLVQRRISTSTKNRRDRTDQHKAQRAEFENFLAKTPEAATLYGQNAILRTIAYSLCGILALGTGLLIMTIIPTTTATTTATTITVALEIVIFVGQTILIAIAFRCIFLVLRIVADARKIIGLTWRERHWPDFMEPKSKLITEGPLLPSESGSETAAPLAYGEMSKKSATLRPHIPEKELMEIQKKSRDLHQ